MEQYPTSYPIVPWVAMEQYPIWKACKIRRSCKNMEGFQYGRLVNQNQKILVFAVHNEEAHNDNQKQGLAIWPSNRWPADGPPEDGTVWRVKLEPQEEDSRRLVVVDHEKGLQQNGYANPVVGDGAQQGLQQNGNVHEGLQEFMRNTMRKHLHIPYGTELEDGTERLVERAYNIFEQHGFTTKVALKQHMYDRAIFRDFCCREHIPAILMEGMAATGEFGPDLPSQTLLMDRHDRLSKELRAWFGGDYDNQYCQQDGFDVGQCAFEFLIHDTSTENMDLIRKSGMLMTTKADDTHYDGRLAFEMSPSVVFFQASEYGGDPSMYPRDVADPADRACKRRIAMNPQHLGLHTKAFLMYFVSITESRRDTSSKGYVADGMLQIHLLFIPKWHKDLQGCDENFMKCNKTTFQPFRYDPKEKKWCGYSPKKGENKKAFGGHPVKVNVCVAQDLPFWYGGENEEPYEVFKNKQGVFVPPGPKKVMCHHEMTRGQCQRENCTFEHTYRPRTPVQQSASSSSSWRSN